MFLTRHSEPSLDRRCLDQLKALSESTALEVLTKYGEADLSQINSKAGFFMGIVKRFREQSLAADPNMTNQAFNMLPPFLRELSPPHFPHCAQPSDSEPRRRPHTWAASRDFVAMSCTSLFLDANPEGPIPSSARANLFAKRAESGVPGGLRRQQV